MTVSNDMYLLDIYVLIESVFEFGMMKMVIAFFDVETIIHYFCCL